MQCKGFLFDLDGTLVDSLPVVERSWQFWAESYGVDPQAVLDFIHGKQAITTLRHFMPDKSEAEIQAEFLRLEQIEANDLDGIRALPGAVALLQHLDAQSVPWPSLPLAPFRSPMRVIARRACRCLRCSSPPSKSNAESRNRTPIYWGRTAGSAAAGVSGRRRCAGGRTVGVSGGLPCRRRERTAGDARAAGGRLCPLDAGVAAG